MRGSTPTSGELKREEFFFTEKIARVRREKRTKTHFFPFISLLSKKIKNKNAFKGRHSHSGAPSPTTCFGSGCWPRRTCLARAPGGATGSRTPGRGCRGWESVLEFSSSRFFCFRVPPRPRKTHALAFLSLPLSLFSPRSNRPRASAGPWPSSSRPRRPASARGSAPRSCTWETTTSLTPSRSSTSTARSR